MIAIPVPADSKLLDLSTLPRPERSGALVVGLLYLIATIFNAIVLAPIPDGPLTLGGIACMAFPCGLLWLPTSPGEKYNVMSLVKYFDLVHVPPNSEPASNEQMYTCYTFWRFSSLNKLPHVYRNGPYTDIPEHMIGGVIFISGGQNIFEDVDTQILGQWSRVFEAPDFYEMTMCHKQTDATR